MADANDVQSQTKGRASKKRDRGIIFQHAVNQAMPTADRPAFGSHLFYGGSCRQTSRFESGPKSRSAFVELHPDFLVTPEDFKALLEGVSGVGKV